MLVLTRKVGQTILINDNIKVTVAKLDNGKVRIAIDAPPDVRIFREELLHGQLTAPAGYTFDESEVVVSER